MEKIGLKKLTKSEIVNLNGGCFAYDIGWFIGSAFSSAGGQNPAEVIAAVARYNTHEH